MKSIRLPPFIPVFPSQLSKAVDALEERSLESQSDPAGRRWNVILGKIEHGNSLTGLEKRIILRNVDLLSESLYARFYELFFNDLDATQFISCTIGAIRQLGPARALNIVVSDKAKPYQSVVPSGHLDFKEKLLKDDWRGLANDLLRLDRTPPSSLKLFFIPVEPPLSTPGQRKIFSEFLSCENNFKLLQHVTDFSELMKVFIDNGVERAAVLNRILGDYFKAFPAWSTQIYNSGSFFPTLLELLNSKSIFHYTNEHAHIGSFLNTAKEISTMLDDLAESSANRGTYWKTKLQFCDYVKVKRLSKKKVTAAFAFKKIVIVESAPEGYAAYAYDREVFDREVAIKPDWRDLDKVIRVAGITRDNGALWHTGDWPTRFNSFIRHHRE